jgi:signal transduction histidine kinase
MIALDHKLDQAAEVLVVDDESDNRLLLREALEATGYLVVEAKDGAEALARIAERLPDVVLLDVMMPGIDGLEVCKRIKSDKRTAPVPVILVTAQRAREDRLNGIVAGADDFLTKPVDLTELRLRLQNAVRLKLLYDEVQDKYREVTDLEKSRDELVHMIVHDLRSPLTVIQLDLEGAEMTLRGQNGQTVEFVVDARKHTKRIIGMVNSMLDVSRLESGKMSLNLGPADLSQLVSEVLASLGDRCRLASANNEGPDHVTTAQCDREVIRRVVENLVGNALDYSPQEEPVSVAVCRRNGHVRVSVSDHGPGIPEDYHERIFDKFGQVGTIRKVRKASTGLGLTFCKLAVEAHSGTIGVESKVGDGSIFWFELPTG